MLELTVRPEPSQLSAIRRRIAETLHELPRSDVHVWRVTVAACELLTLSMEQGSAAEITLRLEPRADATRVEVVDALPEALAFDTLHGRIVLRVAESWGVLRGDDGQRTLWCDVASGDH